MFRFSASKDNTFSWKITKQSFLFFLLWLFNTALSFAQVSEYGTPFVQNISPREYGYESQNFSIVQDKRGVIYIGNLNGVLEYDGTFWNLIKVGGKPSLAVDAKGVVYAGGYNEFGYLAADEKNKMNYVSLITKLPEKNRQFGQISEMAAHKDGILFCTSNVLFNWNNSTIRIIDTCARSHKIFTVGNKIFVYRQGTGLTTFSNGKLVPVPGGSFFKESFIQEILPYPGNKLLIKPYYEDGFYLCSDTVSERFPTQADEFLLQNGFYKGLRLHNGDYAISTQRMGLIIMTATGKVVCHLSRLNGLLSDEIHDMYIDRSGNLWLATSNGISRVEYPSAFSYYDKNSGIKGNLSSIVRHSGILYVSTTQGVYYMKNDAGSLTQFTGKAPESFTPISGITTEGNFFCPVPGGLLVSANDGIYLIKGFAAEKIINGWTEGIYKSASDTTAYYCAKSNGVAVIKFLNGKWTETGRLKSLNKHVRTIAEEPNGSLWLGTNYDGIYYVALPNGYRDDAPVFNFRKGYGLPENFDWVDVYSTVNGILFSTSRGIFRHNKQNNAFYRDRLLGLDFLSGKRWVYPIVQDVKNNLWFSSGIANQYSKFTAVAYYAGPDKDYFLRSNPFNRIRDYTFESIYPDGPSLVWFGSSDGIIRFDSKLLPPDTTKYFTLIRKIIAGKDSVIYYGCFNGSYNRGNYPVIQTLPELSYKMHNVKFEFSAPSYENSDEVLYQYFLEGFDKGWSGWSLSRYKEYTNLPEGDYTFRVHAKNIYGVISEETFFSFSVKPPFYRTWLAYFIILLLGFSFVIMILKWRSYLFAQEKYKLERLLAERTEELVKQKERAEELLANILPKDTAEELQAKGYASRKKYQMVTVLFSDIQGFTRIAEYMNPEILLDELDKFFLHFDGVVEHLGIEKIKTIGDAYMCAGGIPEKNRTNPIDVVLAGLEMREYMKDLRAIQELIFDIRIGVHTGPVIAGVVGSKKFTYDIWGDTVNIASRMESSCDPGEINVSETTHELIKDFFDCQNRGKIPVKYKGDIDMYFVKGIKPELSVGGKGILPNDRFFLRLQQIRYFDLEELIMHKLDKGLPKNLYYHNLKHTIDVGVQVEIIGMGEGVSPEELLILKTAALFHDIGFTIGYDDHEILSIKLAKDILPRFNYTDAQVKIISELIYATKFPPVPKTQLEMILCDADLDYLGRTDFLPVSQNLFRELYERGKIKNIEEWNKIQFRFIEGHQYFTETALKLRNVNKNRQLEELRKLI